MKNPKYSIIIATKNEEEAIAKVLCSIPEEISKQSEIIVVDSSNDYTPIIAEKLGAKVIKERRSGKGRAMKRGVKESKGKILIFLDGDGTDPPEFIPKLLKKLKNSNLVLGCRSMKTFKEDDYKMREIFRIYGIFIKSAFLATGFRASDPLAGFRAIRRTDWDKLKLKSNDFRIETEMDLKALKEGFVVKEIAIPHFKRGGGLRKSKLATNPKMWLKILDTIIKFVKDKKLKRKVNNLKNKLKTNKRILEIYHKKNK